MVCTKCSAVNADGDRFCFKCGAPLPNAAGEGPDGQPDIATQNATTMLSVKEARIVDVRNMRPLTRTAYNIAESEHGSTIQFLVSLLYVVLSLGMVAVLIKIFDTISNLVQAVNSSDIEGSLSEQFYKTASVQNAQFLGWLIVLFIVMVIAFTSCGRLKIRLQKVYRKLHKEKMESRL